jgi:hypothetical protein
MLQPKQQKIPHPVLGPLLKQQKIPHPVPRNQLINLQRNLPILKKREINR